MDGVAFKKTFSYAGFEQQPKSFKNPKICLLNLELELKSEKENAEIRIDNPEVFYLHNFLFYLCLILHRIINPSSMLNGPSSTRSWTRSWSPEPRLFSQSSRSEIWRLNTSLTIMSFALEEWTMRYLFLSKPCLQHVSKDLLRVAKATGGIVQTTVNGLTPDVLGSCGTFEEVQLGAERYNLFKSCPKVKEFHLKFRQHCFKEPNFYHHLERGCGTIHPRGRTIFEWRNHDCEKSHEGQQDRSWYLFVLFSIRFYNKCLGGGAIELELSKFLRQHARSVEGKAQLIINSFAKALEVIPRTISDNAGLDSVDVLNKLRQKHALDAGTKNFLKSFNCKNNVEEGKYFGVDINSASGICNTYTAFIWEPIVVKQNALSAACEVKKKNWKLFKKKFRRLARFCLLMKLLETRNRSKMRSWSKMFNRGEEDHPWWAEVDWDPTWRWDKIKNEILEIILDRWIKIEIFKFN